MDAERLAAWRTTANDPWIENDSTFRNALNDACDTLEVAQAENAKLRDQLEARYEQVTDEQMVAATVAV